MTHHHDVSGGGLCKDDGKGCCIDCGVSLVACPECNGIGYHFNGCLDGDEDIQSLANENDDANVCLDAMIGGAS